MKSQIQTVFFFIILSLSAEAGFLPSQADFANEYSRSIEKTLGLDLRRTRALTKSIYLAHPSMLSRWKIINRDAAATYNSWLKTIEISPDLTGLDHQGRLRLLSIEELKAKNVVSYFAALVFHELSHAEMDIYIEEEANIEDLVLSRFLQKQVVPWFEKHYPSFDSEVAVSELFAYYREEALMFLLQEQQAILIENGVNIEKGKCFFGKFLEAKAKELDREQFTKILVTGQSQPYLQQVQVSTIFINGQDLDLSSEKKPVPEHWWKILWQHFSINYRAPQSRQQLVNFMNQQGEFRQLLEICRAEYWDRIHQ